MKYGDDSTFHLKILTLHKLDPVMRKVCIFQITLAHKFSHSEICTDKLTFQCPEMSNLQGLNNPTEIVNNLSFDSKTYKSKQRKFKSTHILLDFLVCSYLTQDIYLCWKTSISASMNLGFVCNWIFLQLLVKFKKIGQQNFSFWWKIRSVYVGVWNKCKPTHCSHKQFIAY